MSLTRIPAMSWSQRLGTKENVTDDLRKSLGH